MKKKKLKEDKEFIRIRNMLNAKNPKNNFYMDDKSFIAWFKNNNSLEVISTYFTKIMDFPKLKNLQINNLLENEITNLHENIIEIDTGNIWFELSWTALIISKYKNILKDFPNMKLDFESKILLGDFGSASIILDDIEKSFGQSFWLIRNRMILLEELDGIEAQKKYLNELMKKNTSFLFQVLVHFFSISVEKNISATYFERNIEVFFAESKASLSTNYVLFKLLKTYDIEPKYFTSILIHESSTSIIDIYENFIEITGQTFLLKLEKNGEFDIFIKLLKKLDKSIIDSRLINIQRAFGIKKQLIEEEKNQNILDIYENFLIGNNKNVIEITQKILNTKPTYMSLYKIFLESLLLEKKEIPFNDNALIYTILRAYNNILYINDNSSESIRFLFKVMVTYPHLSLSNYIFNFLYDYMQDNDSYKSGMSNFDNSIFSEVKYEIYPNNIKREFLESFKEINNKSIFIKALFYFDVDSKEFSNIFSEYFTSIDNKNALLMYYYAYHKRYNESEKFANNLLLSENQFSKNEARKMILKILLKRDTYKDGLFEVVNRYLENNNSSTSLPIIKVIDKIIQFIDENKENPTEIETSIIFDLSLRFRNYEDFSGRLVFFYELYLTSNSYEKPTELINNLNNKLNKATSFYLKNICIPEVMEKSHYFKSISEVESERIKICHFLKDIDTDNKEFYLEEIKEKEQSLFLRKESSRIKKNKIYVNIDGVRKLCSNELEDDYMRLLVLIKANDYKEDIEIVKIIKTLKDKIVAPNIIFEEALSSVYLPNLKSTEVDKLFDIILHRIKDIFINNKDYGLDVYLSTKIRHGTISNQLRIPLEKENLITLREGKTNKYQDNNIFENGTYDLDEIEKEFVQEYFKEFSLRHDEIIKELNDEILQVTTSRLRKDLQGGIIENENKKALFQYYFSTLETKNILYSLLERDFLFEDFVDAVLKYLWIKTDINLKNIREEVETNIKKEILKNFDTLQASLSKINRDLSELNNALTKARTGMNLALDNVTSWFGRMQDSEVNDYEMVSAIRIVQNTFRKNYDLCSIKGEIDTYFKGSSLDKFVDIYFIIFDNAFKHSGYQDETKIDMEFSLTNANHLNIIISNRVKNTDSLESLNLKIQSIKDEYGTKEAMMKINKEGKTGFNKIWRIITKDLDVDRHELNFEYKKEKNNIVFEIKIVMNVEGLLV